jgi:hypothetical protein
LEFTRGSDCLGSSTRLDLQSRIGRSWRLCLPVVRASSLRDTPSAILVAAIDGGGFTAVHGHCVVASRLCPMVASTSCQPGGVALLDLIVVFTIITCPYDREQVLRHSIKTIAPPEVKLRMALLAAQTRCTSFVCRFANIITQQTPVSWMLDEQRLARQNLRRPLHRLIVRRILPCYTCTTVVRRPPQSAARAVASGVRPST